MLFKKLYIFMRFCFYFIRLQRAKQHVGCICAAPLTRTNYRRSQINQFRTLFSFDVSFESG